MAITAAALTTNLNAGLQQVETEAELAVPIRRAVDALSKMAKWPDMHTSDDTAIVATDASIADPSDIRILDKITVNDGTNDSEPLERMTWQDYLRETADGGGSTGEPDRYCRHGGNIYLYPTANASFTVTAWYWKHHQDAALGIEFGDEFFNALDFGTQMYFLMDLGLDQDPKEQKMEARFLREVGQLLPQADSEPHFVKYGVL